MPHQCTECDEVYPNGSDEVLSGCSNCGGQVFQHIVIDADTPDSQPSQTDSEIIDADATESTLSEDEAQTDARNEVVTEDELEKYNRRYQNRMKNETEQSSVEEPDIPADPPVSVEQDVSEIKEMLNTHFEGVRVIEQGKYEINLTQLASRETQIVSIQEDGKYVINVPETFESVKREAEE